MEIFVRKTSTLALTAWLQAYQKVRKSLCLLAGYHVHCFVVQFSLLFNKITYMYLCRIFLRNAKESKCNKDLSFLMERLERLTETIRRNISHSANKTKTKLEIMSDGRLAAI